MTKTVVITAIVLVAIVMGLSSVVPMMPMAYAGGGAPRPSPTEGGCPGNFDLTSIASIGSNSLAARAKAVDKADGVADLFVCINTIVTPRGSHTIIIDNKVLNSSCVPPACGGGDG